MSSEVSPSSSGRSTRPQVAVLTGGGDRPYALGLAASLIAAGVSFDFIASNDLETPDLHNHPQVRFLNLRGDQDPSAPLLAKVSRLAIYYLRLLRYALTAEPRIFHLLWNNKLELFDRTLLLLYYRLLGKRLVLTVHNVNIGKRDGNDTFLNRVSLKIQYRLTDHLFVHTLQMKRELEAEFDVPSHKISVIPFGINSTVPDTALTSADARQRLGLKPSDQAVLFFGNIAPYKGLEYLVEAMALVAETLPDARLVIAGRPKGAESYWASIEEQITARGLRSKTIERIEYVPDEETELFFKAADVLVLPYTHVFQSGVLFLGYNFGLPVIAADVASLKDDIVEGRTGFVCPPRDPASLARALERYFSGDLFRSLTTGRQDIRQFARERYSWSTVALMTKAVYGSLDPSADAGEGRALKAHRTDQ